MRFPPSDNEEPPLDYGDNILDVDPLRIETAMAAAATEARDATCLEPLVCFFYLLFFLLH
jgi:PRO8NT (NUC069), PrP8 N-terminal domain